MRRRRQENAAVGEDSFLDTTANLVGILIILVVVIGTKTRLDAEEYGRKLVASEPSHETQQFASEAKALQDALSRQNKLSQQYELETKYRRIERDSLLQKVVLARQENDQHLKEIDSDRRKTIEKQQEAKKLAAELENVSDQLGIADQRQRPKIVLEHLPTPMARTVFNREMHVQLKDHMITVIPWERLIEMLKTQIPLTARRQASRSNLTDSLGPIGGFLMNYELISVPGGFELEQFNLQIVDGAPTESLASALSSQGRLRFELASRDAAETVVTVWVYPDSFEEFRQLKVQLFKEGFLTAARPLEKDGRIGGSPHGSRSSAQ